MKKSISKSTKATRAVGKGTHVHTKRATRPGKVERDTPIPYVPAQSEAIDSPRRLVSLQHELLARDVTIDKLRTSLAAATAVDSMRRADGARMHEPGDESCPRGNCEDRPLVEMAAERAIFAPRRFGNDKAASLGTLLCEKLSSGWGVSSGHGVAAGALKTVLGGLEVVRVMLEQQVDQGNFAGQSVDDLLGGLRDLGALAIEIEDRAIRATEDVAAELARIESKAVAS